MGGIIGIVGGVGPFAGLDLQRKVLTNTTAYTIRILPVYTISAPAEITDRTDYLQGRVAENPAGALAAQAAQLAEMGATVIGIPCNTAHAPRNLQPAPRRPAKKAPHVQLLHMIAEVGAFLAERSPARRQRHSLYHRDV
jgi:aspartate racemase